MSWPKSRLEFKLFNQYVAIGYESASRDASTPSLQVKTAICTVTRLCPPPGGTELDMDTIELLYKFQISIPNEETERPLLADC